jgi:hypothetical protein
MKDIIIIDDFFNNPIELREDALSKKFDNLGNYPGMRTIGVNENQSLNLKNKFQEILNLEIIDWSTYAPGKQNMNTCYQLCLEYDDSWVHHDGTDWAAIVYLTPDPVLDSGTGFFLHASTKISKWDKNNDDNDMNKNPILRKQEDWICHTEIKNVFNRCVLYKGSLYHRSMKPGFGRNYLQGRLTQVFFFNT